jgi:hypothetical protein
MPSPEHQSAHPPPPPPHEESSRFASDLFLATVKRAIADAEQCLRDTNHTITAFLAPAQPDPLTTDKLVNELRPVPRMRP